MPTITSIVYQPLDGDRGDPHGDFSRTPADTVKLIADHGIAGDRKAGRSPSRQVNLLTADWLAMMAGRGYRTGPGEFGEQLIVDGIRFNKLKPGLQLAIGDSAVIEITKARTGCDRLEAAQGKTIPAPIKAAIGHMARVVHGGTIRTGDPIRVLDTTLAQDHGRA